MPIKGPVLLYGAGKEARSTRAFLAETYPDLEVFVTVDKGDSDLPDTQFISPEELDPARFGTIVKSPGVSLYKPIFAAARKAGVAVTSNLNLWADHFRDGRPVIAITGTKGKSTTASLAAAMLHLSGVDVLLGGNVGKAPLDLRGGNQTVVLELSSYQTADMNFAPDIAGITTLYPEHVDWHGSVERYYADKLHLVDRDLPMAVALGAQAASSPRVKAAIRPAFATMVSALDADFDAALASAQPASRLRGAHNLDNARLAARIAIAAGGTPQGIIAALAAFQPLPHRLEQFEAGGMAFVDDSISTTPEATRVALEAYQGRQIALIAGGYERKQDYSGLAGLLGPAGVAVLCCLPVTGERLAEATRRQSPHIGVETCDTLEQAMVRLAALRDSFDIVILSPGAPSYNQFANFEARGEAFKSLALALFSGDPTA
ncbi:UDP-N-acetylmuramoyl-L-alanine--D-glutamate ligase [Pelagibacterium montanilacus]|uniref:UDP-N-acetylmuramoyl-L-alanine--D-glutamate ligase n=1 Tax=Pelagibacterium montanilacus TaxID=2185280 RepID=UPI0013DF90AA|nr:UDP-N-acetylmuramoyl-L-alanine--D-glutamate ligase [Pelagibacterium montanilacus]